MGNRSGQLKNTFSASINIITCITSETVWKKMLIFNIFMKPKKVF